MAGRIDTSATERSIAPDGQSQTSCHKFRRAAQSHDPTRTAQVRKNGTSTPQDLCGPARRRTARPTTAGSARARRRLRQCRGLLVPDRRSGRIANRCRTDAVRRVRVPRRRALGTARGQWATNAVEDRGHEVSDELCCVGAGLARCRARYIGGCCRVGPADIAALAACLTSKDRITC